MHFGASLDLRFDESPAEFVRFLDGLGLSHVEVRHGYLDTHPAAPSPRELRHLGETSDVTFTFHAAHLDANPGNLDETHRRATARSVRKTIDAAVAADAGAVVVHGGSIRTRYPERVREFARTQAVRTLRECAEYADDVGMHLCVENQRDKPAQRRNTATPERMARLLEDVGVDSEYLGITLDVGHANCTGVDYAAFVEAFGDRIRVCHLHANDGERDAHDPLPEYRSIAENVGAAYNVLEMKSLADVERCVGA